MSQQSADIPPSPRSNGSIPSSWTSRRTLSLDRPPRAPPLRRQSSHLGHPQPVRCWHPDHTTSCSDHGEVSAPLPIGRPGTGTGNFQNINTSFSFSSSLASSSSTPSSPGWPLASPSTRVFHAYSNDVNTSTPAASPSPTPPPPRLSSSIVNAGTHGSASSLPPSPPSTPPVTLPEYAQSTTSSSSTTSTTPVQQPANITPMPKLACVMVGLPARGKTYVGRKVARYLAWLGHKAKIFNVGNYRRDAVGASQPNTFFDPNNVEATKQRTQVALAALEDMINWFEDDSGYTSDSPTNSPTSPPSDSTTTPSNPRHTRTNSGALAGPGSVAIYDATNSTASRRATIYNTCMEKGIQVMFIESICTSQKMIEDNIREVKISSPDYIGYDPQAAVSDFLDRIHQYEKTYETLAPEECEGQIPYVKLINVGDQVIVNKVRGYLQSRIISFLMNLNITPRSFYFSRHGESLFNASGRIGGDSDLSPRGQLFAQRLPALMKEALAQREGIVVGGEGEGGGDACECTVWTSTLKRTIQTAKGLEYRKVRWKQLDELDTGMCDGMTYEEIEERWPEDVGERDEDKYNYRYHGGESYRDLVARLEPVILELERHHEPNHSILIIGHQAVLRAIYAYFLNLSNEELPYVDIPLHTVVRLTPKAYGCLEERFEVDVPAVDTWRPRGARTEEVGGEGGICVECGKGEGTSPKTSPRSSPSMKGVTSPRLGPSTSPTLYGQISPPHTSEIPISPKSRPLATSPLLRPMASLSLSHTSPTLRPFGAPASPRTRPITIPGGSAGAQNHGHHSHHRSGGSGSTGTTALSTSADHTHTHHPQNPPLAPLPPPLLPATHSSFLHPHPHASHAYSPPSRTMSTSPSGTKIHTIRHSAAPEETAVGEGGRRRSSFRAIDEIVALTEVRRANRRSREFGIGKKKWFGGGGGEKRSLHHYRTTAEEVASYELGPKGGLEGKVILITGGNSGLGKEAARIFALRGAEVIITARKVDEGKKIAEELTEEAKAAGSGGSVSCMNLKLDCLNGVRIFVEEFEATGKPIHYLINNAGIMNLPQRETTNQGFEKQFGVNHVGPFLLTNLLVPIIVKSAPARIVVVSSIAHTRGPVVFDDINFEKSYDGWKAYGQSKTANILFAIELNRQLKGTGVEAFSLHPGAILTGLQRYMPEQEQQVLFFENGEPKFWFKDIYEGTATHVYAVTAKELEGQGGAYLEDAGVTEGRHEQAKDAEAAKRLWKVTNELVGESFDWAKVYAK
ncbi:Fructose-2,6-bisphosphatase [Rhizophlyctis rosea]|nr:Fructose-2,6-bisphosphatase [Rhizophlyctis rosea]